MEQGGSLVNLLDQLQDVTEPPPVSMWPATPAWAVLGAVVLAVLAAASIGFVRHWRSTAWQRAALAELRTLRPGLAGNDPVSLAALQTLLRRVALATAHRADVAPLSGDGWAWFLADTGAHFGEPLARALADAPYRRAANFDGLAAFSAARAWIGRRHA